MTLTTPSSTAHPTLDPFLTLSQLATKLGVSVQTLYDLRCQGRGPRGFRVGRELPFRVSEIDAWIARMEADDDAPHLSLPDESQRPAADADRHPRLDQHPPPLGCDRKL